MSESATHWSAAHGAYVQGGALKAPPGSPWRSVPRRAAVLLLLFAALQVSWDQLRGGALEHVVVHQGIVRPAAALVRLITPDIPVTAVQFSLKAPGGGLNVRNGCEGVEALFLLLAAFAVAPLSWKSRAAGLLIGVVAVFCVNELRVLTLFYAWRADHGLFGLLHGTVTPIATILLICGYYHAWLSRFAPRVAPPG
jgi:exosortase/archaeosortase family protein